MKKVKVIVWALVHPDPRQCGWVSNHHTTLVRVMEQEYQWGVFFCPHIYHPSIHPSIVPVGFVPSLPYRQFCLTRCTSLCFVQSEGKRRPAAPLLHKVTIHQVVGVHKVGFIMFWLNNEKVVEYWTKKFTENLFKSKVKIYKRIWARSWYFQKPLMSGIWWK